jgi:hypothetical protein
MTNTTNPPYRQIRALYDDKTITVYQAYNSSIASAAVEHQKLNASPLFIPRMTWIKPSWNWMMYRCGYSYKDANQSRVLAITMTHEGFLELLRSAGLTTHEAGGKVKRQKGQDTVMVQWDPERSVRVGRLGWRSIQIGIPRVVVGKWVDEWIVGIEDVTDKARELKKELDENKDVCLEELAVKGLVPVERVFEVPEDVRELLRMDVSE